MKNSLNLLHLSPQHPLKKIEWTQLKKLTLTLHQHILSSLPAPRERQLSQNTSKVPLTLLPKKPDRINHLLSMVFHMSNLHHNKLFPFKIARIKTFLSIISQHQQSIVNGLTNQTLKMNLSKMTTMLILNNLNMVITLTLPTKIRRLIQMLKYNNE
ncbi:hypothetical protein B9K06_25370 [Bacillus sp. OG2]|nr:hypothetical protein B9K06_25370 [Bacillus sp. OG2]